MKNPKIENLIVVVIPSETDNGINQQSSVDDILNCSERNIFSITDYFKAQNDEDINLLHWSFLLDVTDIDNPLDITGCNIDGLHYFSRKNMIARINEIILKWGSYLPENENHYVNFRSAGTNKLLITEIIEEFHFNYVTLSVYYNEISDEYSLNYDELPDETIDEIHTILIEYDKEMIALNSNS